MPDNKIKMKKAAKAAPVHIDPLWAEAKTDSTRVEKKGAPTMASPTRKGNAPSPKRGGSAGISRRREDDIMDDAVDIGSRVVGSALGSAAGSAVLGPLGSMGGGVAGDRLGKAAGEKINRMLGYEPLEEGYEYSGGEAAMAAVGGPIAKRAIKISGKIAGKVGSMMLGKASTPLKKIIVDGTMNSPGIKMAKRLVDESAKVGKKNLTKVKQLAGIAEETKNKLNKDYVGAQNRELLRESAKQRVAKEGTKGTKKSQEGISQYYEKTLKPEMGGNAKDAAKKLAESRVNNPSSPLPKPKGRPEVRKEGMKYNKDIQPVKETTTKPKIRVKLKPQPKPAPKHGWRVKPGSTPPAASAAPAILSVPSLSKKDSTATKSRFETSRGKIRMKRKNEN